MGYMRNSVYRIKVDTCEELFERITPAVNLVRKNLNCDHKFAFARCCLAQPCFDFDSCYIFSLNYVRVLGNRFIRSLPSQITSSSD